MAALPPGQDLWADLRVFAQVPPGLDAPDRLRDQARRPAPPPASGPRGALPAFPEPPHPPRAGAPLEAPAPPPPPPPALDFIVLGPRSAEAWFGGQGYRAGETLRTAPYRVEAVRRGSVVLAGPRGKRVTLWTNVLKTDTAEAP